MKRLLGLLVLLCFLALPALALAQISRDPLAGYTEKVTEFRGQLTLRPDGVLMAEEAITYDFGSTPRHGIFRNVPKRYQAGPNEKYYLEFTLTNVTDATGRAVPAKREDNSTQAIVRIGDPDKTVTGRQTYHLSYQLGPLVRSTPVGDLISIDLTGDEWEVPIGAASFSLTLPPAATTLSRFCYTGAAGSRETACQMTGTNPVTIQTTRVLGPGEGLTVESTHQPGAFTAYLQANQKPPIHWERYWGLLTAAGIALLALLVFITSRIRARLARARQTIVPQYESPEKMTPAEIGLLTDNQAEMREVTATLIDLAVRGYLKIEQTAPKKLLRKAKYRFSRTAKAKSGLADYELDLYDALFAAGPQVDMDQLDRTKMAAAVAKFKQRLATKLEAKGFYGRVQLKIGSFNLRTWLYVLGGLGVAAAVILIGWFNLAVWNIIAPLASLLLLALAFTRRFVTPAGLHRWADIQGFKRYLSMVEKDRLEFTDAPKRTPKLFSAMLPYATALGVEQEWAKQFAGIDIAKATGSWYTGHYPLTPAVISNDLSSFASSVSSQMSPVSSSSSSGGGGSSGGGFGGGGGGSW